MPTGTYAPNPVFLATDDDDNPLAGALLYTYEAGTSTPLATYPNVNLTPGTENGNPVVCDGNGRATIFLQPTSYKWILKTAAGVTIWTRDNIGAVPAPSINNDVDGTAGATLTATQVVYLGAGTWSLADADAVATSTEPTIGFVVADTASAATGSFRLSGRMTGFSGLTPGSDYYVSATPGAITLTPPANGRYVGRADSISSLIITPNPRPDAASSIALIDPRIKTICNGRLTLTTALPVTTADVTAAGTLYWTPYHGNEVALYSGTAWVVFALAELSIAVPAVATQTYDVFLNYNAGVPALELTAWTNDSTRATALTTQDGVPVKTGALTRRWVGTVRTVSASQLNDSFALRHVWNTYNRVARPMRVLEATNSWVYDSATYQQANNAAANQLDLVCGMAEDALEAQVAAFAGHSGSAQVSVSIGQDGVTPVAGVIGMQSSVGTGVPFAVGCSLRIIPAAGRHYYTWIESGGGATTTFYGDNNAPTLLQAGIHGMWRA